MDSPPKNCSYVAALSTEVTNVPIARTIAGEDVAMYRASSGQPVALRDRCSHHMYPLSLGKVVNDILVCNYHGFSFDGNGACVAVPGQERVPPKANVRSYELIEQGMWIWIWTGDGAPKDPPPPTPWIDGLAGWTATTGMATLRCRLGLLVDNLLDLSHETYLHGGYIGTPEVAATPIATEIDRERSIVRVNRHMESVECPAFYATSTGLSSPVDRWQDLEYFAPGYYQLHVRIGRPGSRPRPDGGDPDGFHAKILYGLTPSTKDTTHDFWAVCRDFAIDDVSVSDYVDKMQRDIVQQDVDALNALEARIAKDDEPFEVGVSIDRGAFAARRILESLVQKESRRSSDAARGGGSARQITEKLEQRAAR